MINSPEQIAPNVYRVDATKRSHALSVLPVADGDDLLDIEARILIKANVA